MSRKIYTYKPEGTVNQGFVFLRNVELAKYLAKIMGWQYLGELDGPKLLKDNEYLFTHDSLSNQEAERFGISSATQLYGAVAKKILTKKSIFHTTYADDLDVPIDYTDLIPKSLEGFGIALEGYTVFSYTSAIGAYKALTQNGYRIRVKLPSATAGLGQYIFGSEVDFESFLEKVDESLMKMFGLVLEPNIVIDTSVEPLSLSGGWVNIDGEVYSYLGRQLIDFNQKVAHYMGTDIRMVSGRVDKLEEIDNLTQVDLELIESLRVLSEAVDRLDGLLASRFNFDFVYGYKEGDATKTKRVYAVEQSFRVGGATAAEFIGINDLRNNPAKAYTKTFAKINYGRADHRSTDQTFVDNFNDPDYGLVNVWGGQLL